MDTTSLTVTDEAEVPEAPRFAATMLTDASTIIDRAALGATLAAIVGREGSPERARAPILEALKAALASGRAEVRRRFDAGATGTLVVRANCYLMDELIRALYDVTTDGLYPLGNLSAGETMALVAFGGYGRGELAPNSDIDLLFVFPYKLTPRHEQVIETMLYLLWDLGLKVGHAARSVSDSLRQAKADMTIRTALLEQRYLWGDDYLAEELRQRFDREVQAKGQTKFIEAKLAERDTRHHRQGGSRYSLEPNIKEGKGGLRDLHTLFWIAKYLYHVSDPAMLVERGVFTRAEVRRFEKAQEFLWTLRCHLHYETGRAEERLTFDLQKQIAPLMGYSDRAGLLDVERLMKHYFLVAKDVGDLTRILCASLESSHQRPRFRLSNLMGRRRVEGFRLEGHRLTVPRPDVFSEKPVEMLRIFKVAQEHALDIHPDALRWIRANLKKIDAAVRENPEANRIFLDILTAKRDPETALRRLNEAGVFGRFVPDFGRVVAMMQYNMYHHFTVDEHTIFAIGMLHRIETGALKTEAPIASEVVHKVLSRRVLYLAVLLHDIAKGRRGDHSEVGARIAHKLGPRLGLSEEETESVAWLVLHHLDMSHTAFTRDMEDPKTIRDFAQNVQSLERLRLLLVLTVADIRAVGPGTWTAWKAALLRELYWKTEDLLSGGLTAERRDRRIGTAQDKLKLALRDWTRKEIAAHLKRGTPSYWLSADNETLVRHACLIREAERSAAPLMVDTRVDRYREVTEVTVYTRDVKGLFSRIAGAIAVAGGSIDGAKIFTLANGMVLDSFYVTGVKGEPFDSPGRIAKLSAAIEKTLTGRLDPAEVLARPGSSIPSRLSVFKVPPRVLIDNNASADHTVLEVNGRDRPALLFRVTQALSEQNLTIRSAKISTFGERVVDVFYVQGSRGAKITSKAKLNAVRAALLKALGADERAAQARAKGVEPRRGGKAVRTTEAPRLDARR
ncbi:MAG: [protein-PII] uridylyltransferase [Kiloniellales bacterium]|nr:[protein-PII] uridylyltransferase [Kiloniellales bacterium]